MPSQNRNLVHTNSQQKMQKKGCPVCIMEETSVFSKRNTPKRKAQGMLCNHKRALILKASGIPKVGQVFQSFQQSRAGLLNQPRQDTFGTMPENTERHWWLTFPLASQTSAQGCVLKTLLPRRLQLTCSLWKSPSTLPLYSLSALPK